MSRENAHEAEVSLERIAEELATVTETLKRITTAVEALAVFAACSNPHGLTHETRSALLAPVLRRLEEQIL